MRLEIPSLSVERQLLAGLLQHPMKYHDISSFVNISCFNNLLYKTVFSALPKYLKEDAPIDCFFLSQEIEATKAKFEVESIYDHLESLKMIAVPPDSVITLGKQLLSVKLRRSILDSARLIASTVKDMDTTSMADIIKKCDELYNGTINPWYKSIDEEEEIFSQIEDFVAERGLSPVEEVGLMGPHHKLNKIFGSILRPGHYTVFAARSGVGKSQLMFHYAMYISEKYNIPILWMDAGEMTKEDTMLRAVTAITGIPTFEIETGKFVKNKKYMDSLSLLHDKASRIRIFYKNISGLDGDEIVSLMRRFYYRHAGRGTINKMAAFLDYIKIGIEEGNKQEYVLAARLVKKLKDFISSECQMALCTSVQVNRSGITTNKDSKDIDDSENVISLSDEIMRQSAFSFLLRPLTLDEQIDDNEAGFKLIPLKHRFLGEEKDEVLHPVKIGRRFYKNYIRFKMENFNVTEIGTARDLALRREFADDSDKPSNQKQVLL